MSSRKSSDVQPADVVKIPHRIVEAIFEHARDEYPNECCGLLLGSALTIEASLAARNLEASPTSYLIDPADHFAAIRTARASGRSVVGAYHSHPGAPAVPSSRDLAEATFPEFVYLIVSLSSAEEAIQAYRFADGRATRLEIRNQRDTSRKNVASSRIDRRR